LYFIFDDNFEAVRGYCLRRLPADDALDATSEVFLVAWRRIDIVPDGDEARLWLFGVARNTVRTFERATRRVTRLRTRLRGVAATSVAGPEIQVVASLEYQRLLAALDQLTRSDQEVLRLRLWEELGVPEIAAVLDCSEKAASKRYLRALARLNRRVTALDSRTIRPHLAARGGEL
jgi:RNA polymerase sigma-70 factor (ECF subfamily)